MPRRFESYGDNEEAEGPIEHDLEGLDKVELSELFEDPLARSIDRVTKANRETPTTNENTIFGFPKAQTPAFERVLERLYDPGQIPDELLSQLEAVINRVIAVIIMRIDACEAQLQTSALSDRFSSFEDDEAVLHCIADSLDFDTFKEDFLSFRRLLEGERATRKRQHSPK